jgi:hypothetical protein
MTTTLRISERQEVGFSTRASATPVIAAHPIQIISTLTNGGNYAYR